jgi:hypothetical protein
MIINHKPHAVIIAYQHLNGNFSGQSISADSCLIISTTLRVLADIAEFLLYKRYTTLSFKNEI